MSNFEDFLWEMYNEGLRDVVLERVTKLRKLDKYEHLDFRDVIEEAYSQIKKEIE
jgi:hypothetical protein